MKRIVFISHSSADKDIADKVCAYLEQNGVPCWIAPRNVMPGKNYGAAIVDAIDECRVFVLILSSRSNKSRQVVREVERAASSDSVILPFRIENVLPSRELAFYVSAAHWLDAVKYPVEEQFDELLDAIRDWQKTESSTESVAAPAAPVAAAVPPPLPTAAPASVATPRLPPQRKSWLGWWLFAGIGGILLLICGWLLLQLLSPGKPVAKSADNPAAPSPMASPVASGAAAASVTLAEPSATETPLPATTPNEPKIASSPATPLRLRPGEHLRGSASADSASIASLNPSPASQTNTTALASTAKQPIVMEVAATSQLGDEYRPNLAFDGNPATAWIAKGRAMDQTLFVHFKAPALVESVSILNGDSRDEEHYHASNRVRTLRIVLSDGSNQLLTFKDEMKMQRFALNKPATADWIKFEIVSVFPGKTKRTGIAEVVFNEPEEKKTGY